MQNKCVQQITSKSCVKIKEVFSDLFKLRNAINLKRNPLQNNWKLLGVGGSSNDSLEGKFQGVGGGGKN